jgi:hypothetical protein
MLLALISPPLTHDATHPTDDAALPSRVARADVGRPAVLRGLLLRPKPSTKCPAATAELAALDHIRSSGRRTPRAVPQTALGLGVARRSSAGGQP